jgi:phosphohistidine phosphatase
VQLLVIRHAIAVDRATFAEAGKDDDLRPLTTAGAKKMRRIAKGLHSILERPDVLATSPLVRAKQTAEILAEVFEMEIREEVEALRPDARFTMFANWANSCDADTMLAVVGHEPHLSGLVSWLMSGDIEARVVLKKGGACLLTFDGKIRRAGGVLEWLLTPAQLRLVGE